MSISLYLLNFAGFCLRFFPHVLLLCFLCEPSSSRLNTRSVSIALAGFCVSGAVIYPFSARAMSGVCFMEHFSSAGFFCIGLEIAVTARPWVALLSTAFFLAVWAALFYTLTRNALVRALEADNRLQMELIRENSKHLQNEMYRSRVIYHDLRQLLRQLYALSEQANTAELKPYVEKIIELTEHSETVFRENKCLNALLQYYSGCARENDIPITVSADQYLKQHDPFKGLFGI